MYKKGVCVHISGPNYETNEFVQYTPVFHVGLVTVTSNQILVVIDLHVINCVCVCVCVCVRH